MPQDLLQFGDFVLDRGACELRRGSIIVPLQRIPLELLRLLVERHGQLVTREEILERVWGKGVFVHSETSINTAVRKLRRALSDNPDAPRFVATVPAKGYRFVAEIRGPRTSSGEKFRARSTGVMVGRQPELATLLSGLEDAASHRGRLFLISGEPGVGKTRLAVEVAVAADARRMALLTGHCIEHDEAVAYLPFVEILEDFVDRASNRDSLRTALGDQGPELARLLPKLRNILPELPQPLDLPPAQARRHLFNSFCDFAAGIASERPTVMILEDLHWADDSTLSLLDHLTQRLSELPLMVIGTYRDAEINVTRALAKTLEDLLRGRLGTRVKLKGLPRDEVAVMLKYLSGKSPPAFVVSEIFAETEGNPFFVEELFRHLQEENRLYDSSGQFRSKLEIAELEAPPSVRLVVARRLARLSDSVRKMLATAAVIGRSFRFEVLDASSEADADSILGRVEKAEKAGLVFSVAESPKAKFEFCHELIRQAVIGSLSAARRQRLHLDVAHAIERTYSTVLEDYCGELAHHYRLGGKLDKAIDYLTRAAQRAATLYAPQQAIALATTALELLASIPNDDQKDPRELTLQMILGSCASLTKGSAASDVERAYARALELCGRTDRTPTAVRAILGLYLYYSRGLDYERTSALQEKLLELVPGLAEPRLLAAIHHAVGFAVLYRGEFESARHQLEQALRWGAGRRIYIHACAALALALWNLGYPDQASKRIAEAWEAQLKLRDPYAEVMVADNACMIRALRKDAGEAKVYAREITNISIKYGFIGEIVFANIVDAWADGQGGDPKSVDLLRERRADFEAAEGGLGLSFAWTLTAELCLKYGRHDEAVAELEAAIAYVGRTGEGFAESEIYRLKGEAEMQLGRSHIGHAAKWLERAIETARKRSARIAELRATADLARLLAKQHQRDKAHALLADIYNRFTEGFDTADLKDAKALLEQLNGTPSV